MSDNKEQYVGTASKMPGTSGFTMACFKASEVPVGTKLYVAAQPVVLSDDRIIEIWNSMIGFIPDPVKFAHAILAAKEQA